MERRDELYELQRNEDTKTITNLSRAEVMDFAEIVTNGLISRIENESAFIAADTVGFSNQKRASITPCHTNLLKVVKKSLQHNMIPVEYEMLLMLELQIYDDESRTTSEKHKVRKWLIIFRNKLQKASENGGYKLSNKDKLMLQQLIGNSTSFLHAQRNREIDQREELAFYRKSEGLDGESQKLRKIISGLQEIIVQKNAELMKT